MPTLASLRRDLSLFAKYHLVRRVVRHPAPETDLGIVPLGLELGAYAETIRAYGVRGDRYDVSTLAEISYQGEVHPMLHVRPKRAEGAKGAKGARKKLLVLAGVHGNEHAGLLAVPVILERLATDPASAAVDVQIVTPVNPVGAAHLSRYNGEGYDINRDFVRFDTPEARAVRNVVARERPDFIVSLHEGPQDATFLFTNRRVPDALASRLLGAMEREGTTLATKDYFGRTLTPRGLAPMGWGGFALTWVWSRTLRMMPSGFYADERGVPEITIESSWRMADREARVRPHVALVCALADELASTLSR